MNKALIIILLTLATPAGFAQTYDYVSIDLGEDTCLPTASCLVCYSGGDGDNEIVTQDGLLCRQNTLPARYFYFGVSDSWAYQASRSDVYITVEFYDSDVSQTNNRLYLEYDSVTGGASKLAGTYVTRPVTGDGEWKTFSWHITDAYFGNRQNFGADFRIAAPLGDTFWLNQVIVTSGRSISVDLGATNNSYLNGLTCYNAGDGQNVTSTIGGIEARHNDQGSTYFYFGVNDAYALKGNRSDLYVTIQYYDGGTGWLLLQYNSLLDGSYKTTTSSIISLQDSGTWKSHTWHLKDAYFGNSQNMNADFRIAGSGTYYLNNVYVYTGHKVIADLGVDNNTMGLILNNAGDGENTAANIGGLECRKNIGVYDPYFYFKVDDAFAIQGNKPDLYFTIHYYDNGTGWIALQYDAAQSACKTDEFFYRTDTNKWKCHTWHITDAYLGNRENLNSDFRIVADVQNEPCYLNLVYVRDFQADSRRRAVCPPFNGTTHVWDPNTEPFRELMCNPIQWSDSRDSTGAIVSIPALFDPNVDNPYTESELQEWFAQIKTWGMLFSLEVPAVKNWGAAYTCFNLRKPFYDRIISMGGVIDEMSTDSLLLAVMNNAPHLIFDWAPLQASEFIKLVRNNYTDTKIGIIEPYPFFNADQCKWWITVVNDKCAESAIEGPDFYVMDVNWHRFSSNPPVGSWSEAKQIRDWFGSENIPFSMLYWAANHYNSDYDSDWYSGLMAQGSLSQFYQIDPDRYLIQSYLQIPHVIIPETTQYTFTNSVLDFFDAYVP